MYIVILGNNVKKTYSPIIYNNIFKKRNIIYYKLSSKKKNILIFLIYFLSLKNIYFFNITIPFKEDLIKLTNFISKRVKNYKTSNFFTNYKNSLFSYTTDGIGFEKSINKNLLVNTKRALVIGTGGACKSIMSFLIKKFKFIEVYNRNLKKLKVFNKIFNKNYKNFNFFNKKKYFVINTIPYKIFKKNILNNLNINCFKYIINYRTKSNLFDGSNMLYEQALENIKIFYNEKKRNYFKEKIINLSQKPHSRKNNY
ncbi:hypothetical protein ACWNYI_00655 [Candidatus Vidania fulgoroideorum]